MTDKSHASAATVPPNVETLLELLADQAHQLETMRGALAASESLLNSLRMHLQSLPDPAQSNTNAQAVDSYETSLATVLANSAYDSLLVVDEQQRILAINESAESLFGRKSPIGEALVDVTQVPELEMMVLDALRYVEETFEEQITLKARAYRVRVQVMKQETYSFVGIAFQDVTDLVRLNRARRDMVANISHELRNPIANIRLSIDSLFHEQDKPKRKASISALKSIARETDSLLWLVQELYDLSMIESGEAILRAVEVPLAQVVQEAIERMVEIGEGKELHLAHTVPEMLTVLADRDQIRRVLINLIHNGIKFSPVGGAIVVSAEVEKDDVIVSVLDEGPGVPPEHVDRIFERFYQVDSARSRGDGTGLGLAICKHIVEAHDGRIWAESNAEAAGGRFFFTLPLVESSPAE
jgi:two-component system phosphate regulon sensor histidine kinase PhoR